MITAKEARLLSAETILKRFDVPFMIAEAHRRGEFAFSFTHGSGMEKQDRLNIVDALAAWGFKGTLMSETVILISWNIEPKSESTENGLPNTITPGFTLLDQLAK